MRLDRLLTIGVIAPARRSLPPPDASDHGSAGQVLPVLMYHSISRDGETASPYYRICTSPERFRQQMEALAHGHWRGVTLTEGLNWFGSGDQPPHSREQLVALTFDDGYRDFFTHAFPVLDQHGFAATVYLPTGYIADQRKTFNSRECLTWAEVVELHGAGMEFGSHTVTHPKLVELTWQSIETELCVSKATLEKHLGARVAHFAYPFAFPGGRCFRSRFRSALETAGYATCATTDIGRTFVHSDPLQLRRLPVNECDDTALLSAKLQGAYDWLGMPQAVWKHLKAAVG